MGGLARAAGKTWPALLVLAVTAAATSPLCAVLHRCGCTALWSGAASACNVHEAQGPHCPWCEHWSLAGFAVGASLAGQGLVFRAARRRGGSKAAAISVAVAALPALVLISGFLAWLPTDYPHFLVDGARGRLGLPEGPIRCMVGPGRAAATLCCSRGEGR